MPKVLYSGGRLVINDFDQKIHCDLGFSSGMNEGACVGLSLDWIGHHSKGKMDAFISEMRTPDRLSAIADLQNMRFHFRLGEDSMKPLFTEKMHLEAKKIVEIYLHDSFDATYEDIGRRLTNLEGYLLVVFSKTSCNVDSHAIAVFNNDDSYELFDPNYGSAFFRYECQFAPWFAQYNKETNKNMLFPHKRHDYWFIMQFLKP